MIVRVNVVLNRTQVLLTLKMTTAQVVETPVTVNNNSPIQDYVHPDDQTQPTFEMTPGFKLFKKLSLNSYPVFEFIFVFVKARVRYYQNGDRKNGIVLRQIVIQGKKPHEFTSLILEHALNNRYIVSL